MDNLNSMVHGKGKRSFALLNLVTTTAEEAALVVVLLVILPSLRLKIPIMLVVVLVVAWAAWSYMIYRLGAKAIDKMPVVGAEALVGVKCRTTTPLCPDGQVRAGNELWRAYSISGDIDTGVEVVIIGMKGLTLYVTLSIDNNTKPQNIVKSVQNNLTREPTDVTIQVNVFRIVQVPLSGDYCLSIKGILVVYLLNKFTHNCWFQMCIQS